MVSCPEVEWTALLMTSLSLPDVTKHRAGLRDLLGSLLVLRAVVSCSLIGHRGPFQLWLKPLGQHSCSLHSSVEIPIRVGQGGGVGAWGRGIGWVAIPHSRRLFSEPPLEPEHFWSKVTEPVMTQLDMSPSLQLQAPLPSQLTQP